MVQEKFGLLVFRVKKLKKCTWFDTMLVDDLSHCTESTVSVSKNAMHLISYLLLVVFSLKYVLC